MQVFDTSSIIHAWDNHPIAQFPPLWRWLEGEVAHGRLCLPEVAVAEVAEVSPECAEWLTDCGVRMLPMTDAILQEALRILLNRVTHRDTLRDDQVVCP